MISMIYDSRAIPVFFELLPKLGSSNLAEQKRAVSQVLPFFKKSQIIILGDREFCFVQLASWLRAEEVKFCLRLKKSENIEIENGSWQSLNDLGLTPNTVQRNTVETVLNKSTKTYGRIRFPALQSSPSITN